jgi:uncharacterized protein YpmB
MNPYKWKFIIGILVTIILVVLDVFFWYKFVVSPVNEHKGWWVVGGIIFVICALISSAFTVTMWLEMRDDEDDDDEDEDVDN